LSAHASPGTAVWGQDYRVTAAEDCVDKPYECEVFVRNRILALTEQLSRLQAK
jgi:hypothetical protein